MKKVIIFEVEGGSDKWINGHRKDSLPIKEALEKINIKTEILFFREEWSEEIFEYSKNFDGYISRVNPGNIKGGESSYFELLRKLSENGLVGMSHPDEMINFGSKDVLVKIKEIGLVPDDMFAYYKLKDLKENFPKTLKEKTRVLKQNRGSTGSGIWRVENIDPRDFSKEENLPDDTKIKITEAVDNHEEEMELGEFMDFCKKYIRGKNGMIVDTPFMSRITEGEIRILYVGETPIFVVHKKPNEKKGAFSATLFSGAKYIYEKPEKYKNLIKEFERELPQIKEILGYNTTPLIWTADFMLDTDEKGKDAYVLGEINCSCVGFTNKLEEGIQEKIAKEVKERLK